MPHIPGAPAEGHGRLENNPDDGGLIFRGRIDNNRLVGRLDNQSGICGDEVLEKYLTAPQGWFEVTGYGERFADDHSQIERVFEGPWGYRHGFIAWALGFSYSTGPGQLRRVIPVMDAEFPWLYATDYQLVEGQGAWFNFHIQAKDCEGEPILINNQPVYFNKIGYAAKDATLDRLSARVKLTFTALDYEVRSDERNAALGRGELNRYVTRDRTYSMEAVPLPRGEIRFNEGPYSGQPIPENSGRLLLPRQQLRYVWHEVPDEPVDQIEECVGKVNAFAFDGARGADLYAPKTLLCLPPQSQRYRTRTGRVCWRMTYLLLYQPQGWDKFPAADGQFYRVNRDVFQVADLHQLFHVPAPRQYQ